MGFGSRRSLVFFLILTIIVVSVTSCSQMKFSEIDSRFSDAVSGLGGKSVTFEPFSGASVPRELTTLFGRDGKAPDEFSLIEYMQVWYSERYAGGDAAVFYAVNATDTPSIVKMCERRARTLKYSAGIESEIFVNGHLVVFINCRGEYEGIGDKLIEAFGK